MWTRWSLPVVVALATWSLAACGHSSRLEETPWIWSSQWRGGVKARAATEPAVTSVVTPLRVSEQRTVIAPAETSASKPAAMVVPVGQQSAKRRPSDVKRSTRRKR